jgi:hypothetical protein
VISLVCPPTAALSPPATLRKALEVVMSAEVAEAFVEAYG